MEEEEVICGVSHATVVLHSEGLSIQGVVAQGVIAAMICLVEGTESVSLPNNLAVQS